MPALTALIPLAFEEAISWALGREVVLPDTYYRELTDLARAQAFTVSGTSTLDQLQRVLDSLTKVLETGETFQTWQRRVLDGEIAIDAGPAQLETVFRNATQQSYNRGRYEQQASTALTHPYGMYDAVDDSRTRPEHAAMDGMVAPLADPIWQVWNPSCGHRCRCKRIVLTERQAQRFIEADARRQMDPDLAAARAVASPDPGFATNVYNEPNGGLRTSIERRQRAGIDLGAALSVQLAAGADQLRAAVASLLAEMTRRLDEADQAYAARAGTAAEA